MCGVQKINQTLLVLKREEQAGSHVCERLLPPPLEQAEHFVLSSSLSSIRPVTIETTVTLSEVVSQTDEVSNEDNGFVT